jgi:hypothetical protein
MGPGFCRTLLKYGRARKEGEIENLVNGEKCYRPLAGFGVQQQTDKQADRQTDRQTGAILLPFSWNFVLLTGKTRCLQLPAGNVADFDFLLLSITKLFTPFRYPPLLLFLLLLPQV